MMRTHRRNDVLVLSLSLAALSIAACGGSSGSSGSGGSGGTTTTTTDIGITGGGGTGGTGGGTTGSSGCIKCADWAMNGGSPDTICAGDSKTDYDAFIKCVCTDQCAADCAGASPCKAMGMASAACGNCEASKCGTEGTACLAH